MDTNDAIPKEIAEIQRRQKKRLQQLNALDRWTEAEFEEAVHCYNEWSTEMRGWVFPLASIEKLAFDVRTPDKQAKTLQMIAKQMSSNPAY
ncbi:hypothetical protein IC229_32475 [Spirosoma sp. BT702]|uniref:Uncharacterized protein n=1 Tax=Spirosoma profusum TaxID=2771354 RepID=A0A927AVU9_9BACT|nr:hypothetical protein [Spirosoma profusum]MBD2705375.1 hypothetical protein [Spirosoma profusum]